MSQQLLETITKLSHDFGTVDYVKGGGGNTSVKDDKTLWIKPSGTKLPGMTPGTFLPMNRAKINDIYSLQSSGNKENREELVKATLKDAMLTPTEKTSFC